MKEIPLRDGFCALVDDADYAELSKFDWRLHRTNAGVPYAKAFRPRISMHKLLCGIAQDKNQVVEHADGNMLNNQRANLQVYSRGDRPKDLIKKRKLRKEKYDIDPEAAKAATKAWRDGNPVKFKATRIRHTYGISLEQYLGMLYQQDNLCVICNKPQQPYEKALCVDHCHRSSIVRGLLCTKCNAGIGAFDDNPELMRKAVAYVSAPPNQIVPVFPARKYRRN